jgi:hypothetical protein
VEKDANTLLLIALSFAVTHRPKVAYKYFSDPHQFEIFFLSSSYLPCLTADAQENPLVARKACIAHRGVDLSRLPFGAIVGAIFDYKPKLFFHCVHRRRRCHGEEQFVGVCLSSIEMFVATRHEGFRLYNLSTFVSSDRTTLNTIGRTKLHN